MKPIPLNWPLELDADFRPVPDLDAGILIDNRDPDSVYLAVPTALFRDSIWKQLLDSWTCIRDQNGSCYMAQLWTPDVDQVIFSLINGLINLRMAHPRLVQLVLFDPEVAA